MSHQDPCGVREGEEQGKIVQGKNSVRNDWRLSYQGPRGVRVKARAGSAGREQYPALIIVHHLRLAVALPRVHLTHAPRISPFLKTPHPTHPTPLTPLT